MKPLSDEEITYCVVSALALDSFIEAGQRMPVERSDSLRQFLRMNVPIEDIAQAAFELEDRSGLSLALFDDVHTDALRHYRAAYDDAFSAAREASRQAAKPNKAKRKCAA